MTYFENSRAIELGPLDEKVATFVPTGCPTRVVDGCIFKTGDLQTTSPQKNVSNITNIHCLYLQFKAVKILVI